ncbi:hypothetical protein BKA56DRAFT_244012 [Ilyonectria sp. MPI-CAGE-AT-0026]|nr:hypothetical protein BKA56DRAFT_244012 [Ilyonectria sp. MPI-CAGE-AT-0026]
MVVHVFCPEEVFCMLPADERPKNWIPKAWASPSGVIPSRQFDIVVTASLGSTSEQESLIKNLREESHVELLEFELHIQDPGVDELEMARRTEVNTVFEKYGFIIDEQKEMGLVPSFDAPCTAQYRLPMLMDSVSKSSEVCYEWRRQGREIWFKLVHRRYKRYSKLKEPSKKRERCAEQLQDMGDPLPDPRTKKIKIEKC